MTKKKTQMPKIRNDITTNLIEIKIRKYNKQSHSYKIGNLDKIVNFLERHELQVLKKK